VLASPSPEGTPFLPIYNQFNSGEWKGNANLFFLMRVARLGKIYDLLERKEVPNVDSLTHKYETTVLLSPRGIAQPPKSEEELLAAIICVLGALKVLHEEPQIFHRDIRWPNVMRRLDDPLKWFIIDWEDAAVPPTIGSSHFSRKTHSPQVFTDGHGPEVDIWGVGELIVHCGIFGISRELLGLGEWMKGEIAPSTGEALEKIREYGGAEQKSFPLPI